MGAAECMAVHRPAEGIERIRASRTIHGRYSKAAIARRREARQTLREMRALLKELGAVT
jgi:hypothetical protein